MDEKEETIEDIFAGRTLGEVMVAGAEEFIEELKKENEQMEINKEEQDIV